MADKPVTHTVALSCCVVLDCVVFSSASWSELGEERPVNFVYEIRGAWPVTRVSVLGISAEENGGIIGFNFHGL